MTKPQSAPRTCAVCGKHLSPREAVPAAAVRPPIAERILRNHPGWAAEASICAADLSRYRADYVESLLESERGELTSLEREVLSSLREHELLATNVDAEFEKEWTLGERLADRLASFGGMNSAVLYWRPVDPYPFILLNLMPSCVAPI